MNDILQAHTNSQEAESLSIDSVAISKLTQYYYLLQVHIHWCISMQERKLAADDGIDAVDTTIQSHHMSVMSFLWIYSLLQAISRRYLTSFAMHPFLKYLDSSSSLIELLHQKIVRLNHQNDNSSSSSNSSWMKHEILQIVSDWMILFNRILSLHGAHHSCQDRENIYIQSIWTLAHHVAKKCAKNM